MGLIAFRGGLRLRGWPACRGKLLLLLAPPRHPPTGVQQVEGRRHLWLAQLHTLLGAQAAEIVQGQHAVVVGVVLQAVREVKKRGAVQAVQVKGRR